MDPFEKYKILRTYIEHEDNLISARFNWLLTAEALLFLALGADYWGQQNDALVDIAPVLIAALLGGFFSFRISGTIQAAQDSIEACKKSWINFVPDAEFKFNKDDLPNIVYESNKKNSDYTKLVCKIARLWIPMVWVLIFVACVCANSRCCALWSEHILWK